MKQSSHQIIDITEEWFAKAPSLPKNAKQAIVNITPWIVLIFGILGAFGSIAGLGLLTVMSPLTLFGGGSSYGTGLLAALFWLTSAVFMLAAFPGIKARKRKGWNMLFWSELVSFAGSMVSLSIVNGIIGALIGFYILFQIKSYYK